MVWLTAGKTSLQAVLCTSVLVQRQNTVAAHIFISQFLAGLNAKSVKKKAGEEADPAFLTISSQHNTVQSAL